MSLMATAPSTSLQEEPTGERVAVTLAGHGVRKIQPMASLGGAAVLHMASFCHARGQPDRCHQRQHMVNQFQGSERG